MYEIVRAILGFLRKKSPTKIVPFRKKDLAIDIYQPREFIHVRNSASHELRTTPWRAERDHDHVRPFCIHNISPVRRFHNNRLVEERQEIRTSQFVTHIGTSQFVTHIGMGGYD